jgi:Transposase DDE domain
MPAASSASIDHFPAFLARLPPGLDLEALARQTKAFQRRRGMRSGTDVLRLALAWGPGAHSLQRVAAWAGERDIATLTDEALIQRLHGAGRFLEAVASQLLMRVGEAPCWHGRVLRIADSSSLSKQASKGTDWRVHGVYDLGLGGFSHLELTDSHGGEALDRGKPVAGEIRIADRGYANAQAWQRFCEKSEGQVDYIVRMRWNTVRLVDEAGELFDLIKWLQGLPPKTETHETAVCVRSGKHQTPVPIRLVVRRNTPEAIEAAHRRLRQQASRQQTTLDERSLIAAGFLVLATSLPAVAFPAADVLAAYRLRWQIELAFKRLKSLLHIDKIRTKTEAGTRCWLYAHLIVALLCDDLSQDFLESFPSGAV